MVLSVEAIEIPASLKLLMMSPLIVLPSEPEARASPTAPAPALAPSSSINGVPEYPGWVVPSMVTGAVTAGSAEQDVDRLLARADGEVDRGRIAERIDVGDCGAE